MPTKQIEGMNHEHSSDEDFKPRGAITFFIFIVILALIIWFGIYFLMINTTL